MGPGALPDPDGEAVEPYVGHGIWHRTGALSALSGKATATEGQSRLPASACRLDLSPRHRGNTRARALYKPAVS